MHDAWLCMGVFVFVFVCADWGFKTGMCMCAVSECVCMLCACVYVRMCVVWWGRWQRVPAEINST